MWPDESRGPVDPNRWTTALGVVGAIAAAGAFAEGSDWAFAGVALLAVIGAFAPVFHYWPFPPLDRRIRYPLAKERKRWQTREFGCIFTETGEHVTGVCLELTAPTRPNTSPRAPSVRLRQVRTRRLWGPVIAKARDTDFVIGLPLDFVGFQWPLGRRRYRVQWRLSNRRYSEVFVLGPRGELRPVWRLRVYQRIRGRLRIMRRGFQP